MKTLTEHLICELSSATYKRAAEKAALRGDERALKFFEAFGKSIKLEELKNVVNDVCSKDKTLINKLLSEYQQTNAPEREDDISVYTVMNEHDTVFSFSVVNLDGKEMLYRPIYSDFTTLSKQFHNFSWGKYLSKKKAAIGNIDDLGYIIPLTVAFKYKNTSFKTTLTYFSGLDEFIMFNLKDYRKNQQYPVDEFFIPTKVAREINMFIHTINKDHKISGYLNLGATKMTEEGEVR